MLVLDNGAYMKTYTRARTHKHTNTYEQPPAERSMFWYSLKWLLGRMRQIYLHLIIGNAQNK